MKKFLLVFIAIYGIATINAFLPPKKLTHSLWLHPSRSKYDFQVFLEKSPPSSSTSSSTSSTSSPSFSSPSSTTPASHINNPSSSLENASNNNNNNNNNNKRLGDLSNPSSRRKMGPPHRKRNNGHDTKQTGRVAVYCVGSGIDLEALRAHVFRRGFNNYHLREDGRPELTLARRQPLEEPGVMEDEEKEELREYKEEEGTSTSSLPLSSTTPTSSLTNTTTSSSTTTPLQQTERQYQNTAVEEVNQKVQPINEDWEQLPWKTKEMLVMNTQDIFYFDYGCVVFWGLTPSEEKAALKELEAFTIDPVSPVELENSFDTMEFVCDRASNPQRPIRFDRMKLRSLNTNEKLALSYAMAQSSKLFVFEQKVLQSVERTRYLPKELALQGKISCSKKDLNRLIGQLFVEQTEVNLFSSILDTPDFLWEDDEYFPIYEYTRSYLEVDDRVELLNSRLSVIRELLDVLTAQVADTNSTRLEWIIIWLIAIEIVMGLATGPLLAGKRVLAAFLIPAAILIYKKVGWSDKWME
eukprot:gene6080-6695_t